MEEWIQEDRLVITFFRKRKKTTIKEIAMRTLQRAEYLEELLRETLGEYDLLNELIRALDTDTLIDSFEFICRNNDINYSK